jgi:competence protein ComEC
MGGPVSAAHLTALMLAWLMGVGLQLLQRELLAGPAYGLLLLAGVVLLFLAWRWRRLWLAAMFGITLLAFGATGGQAWVRAAQTLPLALEGRDIELTGVVSSLPQRGPNGLRFRFDVEQATWQGQAQAVPRTVSLGWYSGFHEDAVLTQPQTELRAGQRWRFTVRLRRPHGHLNPHGFDYELQLFEQGVRATGYVRDAPVQQLDAAAGHPVERLRQRVRDAIDAHVSDRRAAGVLAALAVGDQSAIERDDWDLFRDTGVAHLMSISGLHVTMFAWVAGLAIGALWRRSTRALLRLPAPAAARWAGLAAALAYAVFAGWGVPAQRTVWMLAVVVVLHSLGSRWPWPLVLAAAAGVVTLFDPWALLQPGFWLSFAAVALLLVSEPVQRGAARQDGPPPTGWRRPARWLREHTLGGVRTQLVATLGLAPLTLVFFHQLSAVGFVANLLAIPLVTLIVTPLALLGTVIAPLWSLAALALQGLMQALGWLAAWPAAVWTVPAAPLWAQCSGLLAALLMVLPLPWRLRWLAVPLVVPLLWPVRELPAQGQFELLVVDVGQGTAVLVRTRHHLLVYDAGPQYSRDSDAGQRVLLPLLRARGETRIHTLLLSHRDIDHVGGARALLGSLSVDEVLSSLEATHPLLGMAVRSRRCAAGQGWEWDGVRFTLLHPVESDFLRATRPNAMSCVLRIEASGGAGSALLTGDIERAQEEALVANFGQALRADVLIVPHHGSRTSSTAGFLQAVQPRVAVFQAGYRNRFGHPAADVVQRYRAQGVSIVASPTCGAWRWTPAEPGVCQRDRARRYWHHHEASEAE